MAETIGLLVLSAATSGGALAAGSGIAGLGTLAGTTIGVTVGGVAIGASVATVVGATVIGGIAIGLSYALSNPNVPKPEDGAQAIKQSLPPRIRGYGIARLAGAYMLFESGGAPPSTSYDVIAFHSGRIFHIYKYYLSDDDVGLDIDPNTQGMATVTSTSGPDDRYTSVVQIEARIGVEAQVVLSGFISDALINGVWNSAFVGDGIAYAGMKCFSTSTPQQYTRKYPKGKPELSVVANCSPCWDPRDLGQDPDNETTWEGTSNPVLHLMDYLTRSDGGMGLDRDELFPPAVLAQWMEEADLCDEYYACDGWFQFDNSPESVINRTLSTCDGWLAESGDGTLSLTVGVYREPEEPPITEAQILGFGVSYGAADEETVNQLDVTYTSPDQGYITQPISPVRDEAAISLTGIVRARQLDLPWVQDGTQADTLARRAMLRLNPKMSGTLVTTLYGLRYIGKRWVKVQFPPACGAELADCVVEIQDKAKIDILGGRVTFAWNLVDPAALLALQ